MLKVFLVSFFTVLSVQAQVVSQEFKPSQLSFDFMSSEGSFWYDCTHVKAQVPHDWIVTCQGYTFNLHLLLYEYIQPNEATYEFHYWADEVGILKQSHTQSTWLTVDKEAKAKRILAYLGFSNDAQQLRLEVKLK
jgi:hypothetical protein